MTANVADLVADAARRDGQRIALLDGATGATQTWGELDAEVDRLAGGYAAQGLATGDRVVLAATTTARTCAALFAVLRRGAVLVPIAPDAPGPATGQVVAESGARFGIGGIAGVTELTGDGAATGAEAAGATEAAAPAGGGEDLAVLCYTSGTTAGPVGVMLSHRALLATVEQCARIDPAPVRESDRVLAVLPLFHIYGLTATVFQVAAAGATAVLLPAFHPRQVLDVIAEHRVSTLPGVPSMFAALLATDQDRFAETRESVRLLTSGAAPLPDAVRAEVASTGLDLSQRYGLTEAAGVVTWTLMSAGGKPASVGRPIPGVEVKLVDSDGADLPEPDESGDDRDEGRVAVRGANLFSGYWPDARRAPGEDGWFVTGDVGYFDADGDLHLVDRAGDLIIVNGFNVFPREVEEVLSTVDGVVEAAVVGVPDERTGEAVRAILVCRDGADLSAEDVRAYCARRLARFKVPQTVEFAEELPHTATGKLFRRTLRS